jgi:hypothetical protein
MEDEIGRICSMNGDDNESSRSMKYIEVIEQLHSWRLLKKGSAP